ncbi:6710_t:CDS:2, partial [Funneliformis mosseae]
TTEPESSVSTNNNNKETPVIMDVDPLSLDKGKGKEVLTDDTSIVITSEKVLINVDDANDTSENFLNNKKSPQEIFTKKTNFFAFFPADDYPEKSLQAKISDVTDLIFDHSYSSS